MSNIQVPTRDQVNEQSQAIFDQLEKGLGMVPNLYATIGYSSNTLSAFLAYAGQLDKGSITKKEAEVARLAVSQVNGCAYCLAAHTMLGKMAGLTEADTINARAAVSLGDAKLDAIANLARSIAQNRGNAEPALVEEFYNLGYTNENLIDLLAVVVEISFTNYAHNLTKVPVDFPAAPALEVAAV